MRVHWVSHESYLVPLYTPSTAQSRFQWSQSILEFYRLPIIVIVTYTYAQTHLSLASCCLRACRSDEVACNYIIAKGITLKFLRKTESENKCRELYSLRMELPTMYMHIFVRMQKMQGYTCTRVCVGAGGMDTPPEKEPPCWPSLCWPCPGVPLTCPQTSPPPLSSLFSPLLVCSWILPAPFVTDWYVYPFPRVLWCIADSETLVEPTERERGGRGARGKGREMEGMREREN